MQVSNTNFFWVQNGVQNKAQQNNNVRMNPMLQKIINAITPHNGGKTSEAISDEMAKKIKQNTVDAVTTSDDDVMKELSRMEQMFLGDLQLSKIQLRNLVLREEEYNRILDGTADYDRHIQSALSFNQDTAERLGIVDFHTFAEEQGLYSDPEKKLDASELVTVRGVNGMNMVLPKEHVPVYEQWHAEQVEKLKVGVAEQLPKIQEQIKTFPSRIASMYAGAQIGRLAILAKLTKPDEIKNLENYLAGVRTENDLIAELRELDPTDGKAMLALLNKLMKEQSGISQELGGKPGNAGFEPINNFVNVYV